MSEHKHDWYVKGSHESEITDNEGWSDLELECIASHDQHECQATASVMVNIDPSRIRED